MKLIIDIPDYEYRQIKEVYEKNDIVENTYSYIYHGTPLDSNSERAAVQAYFDGESFGWDEGREALIEELKAKIVALPNANPSYWHSGDMVEREEVFEILDNIGKDKGGE